jgi:hypothetical protein
MSRRAEIEQPSNRFQIAVPERCTYDRRSGLTSRALDSRSVALTPAGIDARPASPRQPIGCLCRAVEIRRRQLLPTASANLGSDHCQGIVAGQGSEEEPETGIALRGVSLIAH